MNILVFCPNLVGDTVMATPTFRALRSKFSDTRIVAVMKPKVAPTLEGNPWFDDWIGFDPRSSRPEERLRAVLPQLQTERADLAVLLPNSLRSAIVAWRSGAKRRVGYARGGRGWLLTDRLQPIRDQKGAFLPSPIVDSYLGIARHLGCEADDRRVELFATEKDEASADQACLELGIDRSRRLVCLNTGGAFGPAKSWPVEHFASLAGRLVDETDVAVLVVCGPAEREAARTIVGIANRSRVVSLADLNLGIGLTKACIRRSALLVTTDSGPRHFGTGFDIPTLTLFGPTHIAWTLSYHRRSVHLHHPVPCGPCQKPTCSQKHHRCLRDLSPNAVFRTAVRMLAGRELSADRIEAV